MGQEVKGPYTLGQITLRLEQASAMDKLERGNILLGDVGSGKTFTSIFWAHKERDRFYRETGERLMIYIITTAIKRDLIEPGKEKPDWQTSLEVCGITEDEYVVDSWNNIKKYKDVMGAIFIFDEQRVVGYKTWGRTFINIARHNDWILLSATPGDNWMDYMTVFIANNFYRNKTEFTSRHVIYDARVQFPRVKQYIGTALLERRRQQVIVRMEDARTTTRHKNFITCGWDTARYKMYMTGRWNDETQMPIQNASELTQLLRKVVATDPSRISAATEWIKGHPKAIIFYNYNYELDILREICLKLGRKIAEWNGQKHDEIPITGSWCYLVQYTAGAEGWNCVETDSMLFYSANYSYRKMEQAEGRIDRMNTPFTDLYYTVLTSEAKIDKAVLKALKEKKTFNESAFVKEERVIL